MQLLIPVTLVSSSEIKSSKIMNLPALQRPQPNMILSGPNTTIPIQPLDPSLQIIHSSGQNHKSSDLPQLKSLNDLHQKFGSKYRNIQASKVCPKQYFEKESEQQLQKKSTCSSLHERIGQESAGKGHQNSTGQINIRAKSDTIKISSKQEQNLETEGDVLPQLICSCKICLETSGEATYDPISNPIFKVCNCIDYVHMRCLEEWITRRDILNEEIEPHQCEVCLAFYQIELHIESFISFQIFCKNIQNHPKTLICQSVPSLIFLTLSVFGIVLLAQMIAESESEGGEIRALLSMPYGTCITIIVFLLFILVLIFGIFLYTWVMQFCVDFKFKIGATKGEKPHTNKLKKMFSSIR